MSAGIEQLTVGFVRMRVNMQGRIPVKMQRIPSRGSGRMHVKMQGILSLVGRMRVNLQGILSNGGGRMPIQMQYPKNMRLQCIKFQVAFRRSS
jgi:hypothetical protein